MADHLVDDARSLPESRVRCHLVFAGLPEPGANAAVHVDDRVLHGHLTYLDWRTVLEYEGTHHQSDRSQYLDDIDRYALYRAAGLTYLQITKELGASPQTMVRRVHAHLVTQDYDGPEPNFGPRWQNLFRSVGHVARSPRFRRRAA